MQTVLLFAAKAATALGFESGAAAAGSAAGTAAASSAAASAASAAAAAGFVNTPATLSAAAAGATAAGTGINASTILAGLRIGTTALTALSINAQAMLQAQAQQAEAFDAQLQSRQEFTQAQERANQIERDFGVFVEQTLAAASASGFDVASGSVREARDMARADADRQLTIDRNGAAMNAALRRGRANLLRGSAAITRQAGRVAAAGAIGQGAIDVARLS